MNSKPDLGRIFSCWERHPNAASSHPTPGITISCLHLNGLPCRRSPPPQCAPKVLQGRFALYPAIRYSRLVVLMPGCGKNIPCIDTLRNHYISKRIEIAADPESCNVPCSAPRIQLTKSRCLPHVKKTQYSRLRATAASALLVPGRVNKGDSE
jgi:hypothetical protein